MDGKMGQKARVILTGDVHGENPKKLKRIEWLCDNIHTTKEDILAILGDVGINYYGAVQDREKKEYLQSLPITLFCIQGNHEERASNIPYYKMKLWHGGIVYYDEEFPDILFAKDGEIYDLNGKKTIVIGGAYSPDWLWRLQNGEPYWRDEQPSDEIKAYVEKRLEESGWKVDIVLTHTIPKGFIDRIPKRAFLQGIDQDSIDQSTEEWLQQIEDRLDYKKWYCGHFHVSEQLSEKVEMLFLEYAELPGSLP